MPCDRRSEGQRLLLPDERAPAAFLELAGASPSWTWPPAGVHFTGRALSENHCRLSSPANARHCQQRRCHNSWLDHCARVDSISMLDGCSFACSSALGPSVSPPCFQKKSGSRAFRTGASSMSLQHFRSFQISSDPFSVLACGARAWQAMLGEMIRARCCASVLL